ncbi:myb-related transcription factor, partner of profilin-like [Python bivittatus]|uniref:Myb-related transcription factor, partner of profilin-like n=1 Tax=Python bivittatus TaxID=176946 RepID=A0A9F2WK54_PYTBI|nr:myb-related transcription factor, partner of profilin-like [Python bivittatus]
MCSSAAERGQWGVQFESSPSTSAAASLPGATGRKRKANFSNDETETLVWNVVRHFGALYGSESFRAHPVRRKQLWTQIQSRVNFLGYTERSIDDLKHKWRDLRLDVKKKITAKKPPAVHRTGPPHKPRLTPLEKMVASTFLQPTHDSEPEIVLDPEIFFPGASKQTFGPMQPGSGPPGIYIDTNGQPSALPEMDGAAGPRLGVRSPDPSLMSDYARGEGHSSSADSGPELRTPETSTVSPPLRNDSLVSYASEEEDREGPEGDGGTGLDPSLSAEEDLRISSRQAMLLRRCNSQGSGLGCLPRGLMGAAWEKQPPPQEEEQQPPRSPVHVGALHEESLPSSASPQADQGPAPHPVPRGIGGSRPRESSWEPWRTNLYRLMEMEDRWDQLYHQELAVWQEERAQQRDERARDRELQLRLLGVLTDIRDELWFLRQERASPRREGASKTSAEPAVPAPASLPLKPEGPPPKPSPEPTPLFYPIKAEACLPGPPVLSGGRGERGAGPRSPHGVPRRGRGRPRGSTSRHRRLFMAHS